MSSEELNRFEYSEEHEQEAADNDQSDKGEKSPKMDGLSGSSNVNAEIKYDDDVDQNEQSQEQQERVKEQPHSDNTHSFKEQFDSAPTFEERRAERRRERRQRRKLTEEEDGPTEGSAQSTLSEFEEGKIDDIHFQKTDTSQDSMASEGMVSLTTAKFKSGNVNVSSEDDDTNKVGKGDGDKSVVEIGTAASRRRALEEYAEEAQKDKGAGDSKNTLEDEGIVLSVGSAASTKAKLERLSSEEKVLEKQVDENAPKRGAASEKRAKFEEKTRQSSEEKDEEAKKPRPAQQASKWPEPKTNYKERRGLRRSASTDEDNVATTAVDKENAKNIEKNKEAEQNGNEEPTGRTDERQRRTSRSTRRQSSTDEEPRSPVRTSEIRNKLVRMLSQEERPPPVDRIGSARPSLGTARNLRARFEAGQVKAEDSHFTGKKPSISARSGYASKVRERFESGEVSRRRYSSTVDEEELVEGDAVVTRRRRTSSARSSEGESVTMSRSAKELRNRFENPPQSTNQQVKRNFVLRSKTASTLSSKFNKSSPVRGPAINKCTTCAKTVYPMEMITADDKPFHRFCFKCTECKATLRLGNYAALQGKIYCKPHFKQLFKVKGNYDEGFGRQQHKKHWEEKGKTEENGENGNDENENDINSDLKSPTESKHEITNGYDDEDTSVNNNARLHDMQDALFEEVDA